MKFGYSTNAFVKTTLFDAVEKVAALGFGGIEIMADRPHLYPPDFPQETLLRLKGLIQKNGLAITNLNSFTLFAVGDTYLPSGSSLTANGGRSGFDTPWPAYRSRIPWAAATSPLFRGARYRVPPGKMPFTSSTGASTG
jgi:hypothetical protein